MSTAVVISSCDLYSDCWAPMIYSIEKYWPDCPYPIFLIANYETMEFPGVSIINVGEHKGFGSNMKKALRIIQASNILLLLDDFFLCQTVDTAMVESHVTHCESKNVDFLKIDSSEIINRDNLRISDTEYCLNPISNKYSINAAIAIWQKSILEVLCVEGFSAWDFERKSRSVIKDLKIKIKSETIYSQNIDTMTIKKISGAGAVRKGRWTSEGILFLKENGFKYLIPGREKEGPVTSYLTSLYSLNPLIWLFPGLLLKIIQKLKINI
jgi:hypothetical protein